MAHVNKLIWILYNLIPWETDLNLKLGMLMRGQNFIWVIIIIIIIIIIMIKLTNNNNIK